MIACEIALERRHRGRHEAGRPMHRESRVERPAQRAFTEPAPISLALKRRCSSRYTKSIANPEHLGLRLGDLLAAAGTLAEVTSSLGVVAVYERKQADQVAAPERAAT